MALTGKQRRFLRALGHPLPVVVRVGRGGASDAVADETRSQLEIHELIKIRVANGDKAKTVAEALSQVVDAEVAQVLGKTALLFKQRTKEPSISLPAVRRTNKLAS